MGQVMRKGLLQSRETRDLKAKAQQAAEGVRARFLVRRPFLAQVAMRLDLVAVIDDRVRTAATDGRTVYVDARYFLPLSPEHREFVLGHEFWHCALGHIPRARGRDRFRWNLAIDHETNDLLRTDGFVVPDDAIVYPDFEGRNAEQVYSALGTGAAPKGSGFDLHLPVFEAPGEGAVFDPDFRPGTVQQTVEEARALLLGAADAAVRFGGTLPGTAALRVDEIRKPRVDWRAALARFVSTAIASDYTWARPQRRLLHAGIWLPGRRARSLDVVIAIDVSGSTIWEFPNLMAESLGICRSGGIASIHLIFFDTAIRKEEHLVLDQATRLAPGYTARGGGGTDLRVVFDHLAAAGAAPSILIVLTDGYGPAPLTPPDYPVLWALTPDGAAPTAWGEVIQLPERKATKAVDG